MNMKDLPHWLQAMAVDQDRTRKFDLKNKVISTTSMLMPAHMLRLLDKHWYERDIDAMRLIPAMVGTAWHQMAEKYDRGGQTELRVEQEFNGWTITGQIDFFDAHRIVDRKTTKVWSKIFGKPEWEQQLNIYHWLLRMAGYDEIESLEVHVIYTDWSESMVKRNEDAPKERFEVIQIPIWDKEEVELFMKRRLRDIEEHNQKHCNAEERWERDEYWAVRHPSRQRAIARCRSKEEAEETLAGLDRQRIISEAYIEHHPGDPIRCRNWCSVKQFCEFGKRLEP